MPDQTGHTVEWTLEAGYGVHGKLVCHEPEGADCRLVCPKGCELYMIERDERGPYHMAYVPVEVSLTEQQRHDLTPYLPGCVVVEWGAESGGPGELYDGEDCPPRNGPIEVWWESEEMHWRYPDPEPTPQG